jgi:hypothetical protein
VAERVKVFLPLDWGCSMSNNKLKMLTDPKLDRLMNEKVKTKS